jgi:hypothetical protein
MKHSTNTGVRRAWIGEHPQDGGHYEAQCARCGSSLDFEDCEYCGGSGYTNHDCGEDCCICLDPEDNVPCDCCGGRGTYPRCVSSKEWCQAHPLPGRENMASDTPEWFLD